MKIRITQFNGYNPEAFANIVVGSIHPVIRKWRYGWYIKGSNGKEVLIMAHEAEEITED